MTSWPEALVAIAGMAMVAFVVWVIVRADTGNQLPPFDQSEWRTETKTTKRREGSAK